MSSTTKSFSEELVKERTFELGGETFEWRYLHWREYSRWLDERAAAEDAEHAARQSVLNERERLIAEGKTGDDLPAIPEETVEASFEALIGRIAKYVVKDQLDLFNEVVNDEDREIPGHLLRSLADWLLEVQTGRPTEEAPTSGDGPSPTAP